MSLIPRFARSRDLHFALVVAALAWPLPAAEIRAAAPTRDKPRVDLTRIQSAEDPHAEMERLFQQVERRQREINALLERARQPSRVEQTEVSVLLEKSEARSREVSRDIDRILELAGHTHPGGGT